MSNDRLPFTGLGPFQAFFHGLSASEPSPTALPVEHMMRGFARCQLEVQGLVSRRARAYVELPSRLTDIHTTQDLIQEQTRFWQTAMQQYAECSQRIMSTWMQSMQPSAAAEEGQARAPVRDYLAPSETASERYQDGQFREVRRRVA